MTSSLVPLTGTASVVNGSTTVTVVAPLVLSKLNCAQGAQVFLAGAGYFVASDGPTDTTHFTLERAYEGSTGTVTCSIGQVTPEMTSRIALAKTIAGYDASAQLIAANQAGLSYQYSGSTAAPAAGQVALNNATPSTATVINFAEADLSGQDISDRLGLIEVGDELTLRAIDGSARVSFIAAAAPVDGGSYRTVPATFSGSAGVLAAGAQVVVERVAMGLPRTFATLAGKPTTLAGYGIIDAFAVGQASYTFKDDSGVNRWVVGIPGSAGAKDFFIFDLVTGTFILDVPADNSRVTLTPPIYEGANRVYSPNNPPPYVGTVSQSGGVPTGAVIERGSNANGSYVRFADGTQICWGTAIINQTVAAGAAAYPTLTPPAAFAGAYSLVGQGEFFTGAGLTGDALRCLTFGSFAYPTLVECLNTGQSGTASVPSFTMGAAAAASLGFSFVMTGRWF